jgi:hypothetical protein
MKRRWMFLAAGGTAVALVSGCAPSTGAGPSGAGFPRYQVGDDTVFVAPYEASAVAYSDVRALVASTPIVIVGTVAATNDLAAEVAVSANQEGVLAGEGPDLYGSITFKVTAVLKGKINGDELRVVYESGKRDGKNPAVRIAYQHDGLAAFQADNGTLHTASELAGRQFVVFASPNTGVYPVSGTSHCLAHPYGIAEVTGGSALLFSGGKHTPVMKGTAPVPVTLAEVRAAAA